MKRSRDIRVHARQRAIQRYGVNISNKKRKEIINMIHSGVGKFVRRRSVRVTEWEIPLGGEIFRVLYDKIRKDVVTFLPPKAVP
ncbi:MAG: hypothetical protein WC401_08620 [Bacteroidales bacterium]|jgi:hypothetical protein